MEDAEQPKYPEDQVGPFRRSEIDRGSTPMSGEFVDDNNWPLLGVAVNLLEAKGSIAIFDAGCGTGHALWDVRDQTLFKTGNMSKPELVVATGVNNVDYSQESSSWRVRKAIANGDIRYIVDDLETVAIPPASQDIIWSYETLLHNPNAKIAAIIRHLLPALKADGRFYFNIAPEQRDDPEVSAAIDEAKQNGMLDFEYGKEKFGDQRIFVMLENRIKEAASKDPRTLDTKPDTTHPQ